MLKLNCWEFKKCGLEFGGARSKEFGVCPAARVTVKEKIHGGVGYGRACWVIENTLCDEGKARGSFSMKFQDCLKCNFFLQVRKEEGDNYIQSKDLLTKLKK